MNKDRFKCLTSPLLSSDIRAGTEADKRIGQALRNLLCGALWLWTICFYCVGLGHMFLLCGALWLWTICFYCVGLGHMFLLCGALWLWTICFYCVGLGHM